MKPRASRIADIVASVPELTNRTCSTGVRATISSASSTSVVVGVPYDVPRATAAETAWDQVRLAFEFFTPEGRLNGRDQAEAVVAAALPRLGGEAWAKTRRLLMRRESFTFLDQIGERLAGLGLAPDALTAVREGSGPKGDVLATARIAGIMAAKKTAELIPLCHPLALDSVTIDFAFEHEAVAVSARASLTGRTGVEMEAMTACCTALLTIYDMAKAIDKAMVIGEVRLRLPNRHHLLVDLAPFGLENPNEVFHVDDRPYGLIEGTVLADGVTADDGAW